MEFFVCPVCLQPYRNSRVLPCLHSFCDACLRQELPAQSFTLVCPVCRQQFILPPRGISAFAPNPLLSELLNEHDTDGIDRDVFYCSSHSGQSLRFYCNDCDSAICSSCSDIEHGDHRTVRLENAAMEHHQVLHQIVQLSKAQLEIVQKAKCQLQDEGTDADDGDQRRQIEQIDVEIEQSFEQLLGALSVRKEQLQQRLEAQKTCFHDDDVDVYSAKLHLLSSIVDITERVMKRGNPLHLILLKKQLEARADLFKPAIINDETSLKFQDMSLNDVDKSISDFDGTFSRAVTAELSGAILEHCQAVASRTYRILISFKRAEEAADCAHAMSPVPKVHVRGPLREDNYGHGDSQRHGTSSHNSISIYSDQHSGLRNSPSPTQQQQQQRMPCPLHPNINQHVKSTSNMHSRPKKSTSTSFLLALHVRELGNNNFETVLSFPQHGQYEVDVMAGDHHLPGSPFKIDVCRQERMMEPKISRRDSCRSSTSSRRSESRLSHSYSKMMPIEDDLIFRIGHRGRSKGEFTNPQDICSSNNRMVATDSNNQCVQVFSSDGDSRFRFGERGRLAGQLQRPTGVTVMPDSGQYLVADYENRWISVFEPNGKYTSRFGMGKLLGPKGLTVDRTGKIYVVDNKASSICVFQNNGRFVGRFGSRGCSPDHLAGPHFIAVNSCGHVIVSDFHNHAVKVFDTSGQFLYSFGSNGEAEGQFNAPTGIAVDPFDNILVADWGNSRIQVFDRLGSYLQSVNSGSDPLYGPQGLALTQDGNVLVADSGNHCLKLYKYSNWVTSVSEIH